MSPSTTELAAGRKAYERFYNFQRYENRTPRDLLSFLFLIAGLGVWSACERGGWKTALGTAALWAIITAVSICQYQRLKKQANEASVQLKTLKDKHGEGVYSEIEKGPHSLYYYVFLKRYLPFTRQSIKLP